VVVVVIEVRAVVVLVDVMVEVAVTGVACREHAEDTTSDGYCVKTPELARLTSAVTVGARTMGVTLASMSRFTNTVVPATTDEVMVERGTTVVVVKTVAEGVA
jgi:hypothetical protein